MVCDGYGIRFLHGCMLRRSCLYSVAHKCAEVHGRFIFAIENETIDSGWIALGDVPRGYAVNLNDYLAEAVHGLAFLHDLCYEVTRCAASFLFPERACWQSTPHTLSLPSTHRGAMALLAVRCATAVLRFLIIGRKVANLPLQLFATQGGTARGNLSVYLRVAAVGIRFHNVSSKVAQHTPPEVQQ